jgi:2-(1,2-epoxy-1,2-dihydrophenyl)acetyl-CoA isomerase
VSDRVESPDEDFVLALRDGVLTLSLNRPAHGNAIAPAMVPGLTAAFQDAQRNPAVRCLVIAGHGKHFCSGGDVAGFARDLDKTVTERQADFGRRLGRFAGLIEAVVSFDRPIIGAVRGVVAGAGLMFALAADIVIGDDTSLFLFSHQKVGLSPDGAVSYFLPRLVGARTAARLVLTAARVDAQQAARLGLLSEVVPSERLDDHVCELAARFAKAPQHAVRLAKSLLQKSATSTLAQQLAAERAAIVTLVGTPDFAEGVRAFMEKRAPAFPSCLATD